MIYKIIYNIALFSISPIIFIYLIIYSVYLKDISFLKNKLGHIRKLKNKNKICVHCASLGEINGAKELIKKIKKNNNILISTNTISGKNRAMELFPEFDVVYFPLDYKFIISTWLKAAQIQTVLIYETEIWPNFYSLCKESNIKICIVNARIQKDINNKSKFLKKLYLDALNKCSIIMCKSGYEKEKYLKLGVNEKLLFAVGNLKYAYTPDFGDELSSKSEYFLMVSTHEPDEENFLDSIKYLNAQSVPVIIAPRHIKRSGKLCKYFEENKIATYIYSDLNKRKKYVNEKFRGVIIIDTFGDLSKFYYDAKFIYVGGGYSKRGIQNIIEPSTFGRPILVGPNIDNFFEEIINLRKNKGITVIEDDKLIPVKENILKNVKFFYNLDKKSLARMGGIAKAYTLKFNGVVDTYCEFLKKEEMIS